MAGRYSLPKKEKYGWLWEPLETDYAIESHAIRLGGRWASGTTGAKAGMGLKFHMKQFISLLWPDYQWHKWNNLQLECWCDYRIIGTLGPASSGKTNAAAVFALADYYVWSDCTTVLVSSTERETLEMRIFGEMKAFHNKARALHPEVPGKLIESKQRIVTDERHAFTEEGRDFRNGIVGVPLKKGGNYQGLGSLVGFKNKRMRLIADELSLCPRIFVDAISNLNKNPDFKCLGIGNPKDTTDALGVLCEPCAEDGGWDSGIDQSPVTKTWKTRFDKGICIQLPGMDCPNMDAPEGAPPPYPFLITREAIDSDRRFYGEDSLWFSMMNMGKMPRGQGLRRVITRQMCLKFEAMNKAVWMNEKHTKIGFLDAAYGAVGGDRCMFGELWFGKDPNDKEQLEVQDVQLVPVSVNNPDMPEDQIAKWVKDQCELRKIPPENFYFDSTGRGTLVGAFARLWSPNVGLVEFGGSASPDRYVSDGIKIFCRDYYFNYVTQLWFQVALCIQAGQFRGLTDDMLAEGSMREWGFAGKNKIQVEPKEKMRLKSGRSPDLFDALVAGVEGAIRRGFTIQKLMLSNPKFADESWKKRYAERMASLEERHALRY